MPDLLQVKAKIRSHYLTIRNKIPESWRQKLSNILCSNLIQILHAHKIEVVHAFIPFGKEISILPFMDYCLKHDLTLVTPKIDKKPLMQHYVTPDLVQVKKNKFGISETTSQLRYEGKYDLILVPGVVFSMDGYRIGYGGGYYDYFLADQPHSLKIGVGYPSQLVEKIPHDLHDIPVNRLILGNKDLLM